jgi:peptide deformylase
LSIPGLRGAVPRWTRVAVEAVDVEGRPIRFSAEDYEARILQHEVDHLDGVLYLDRMTSLHTLGFDSEAHHLLEG